MVANHPISHHLLMSLFGNSYNYYKTQRKKTSKIRGNLSVKNLSTLTFFVKPSKLSSFSIPLKIKILWLPLQNNLLQLSEIILLSCFLINLVFPNRILHYLSKIHYFHLLWNPRIWSKYQLWSINNFSNNNT